MHTVGLFEAKQRLSELVERAGRGEEIGITRRGQMLARLMPARRETAWKDIFAGLENIRQRATLPRGVTVKKLIEEGRV